MNTYFLCMTQPSNVGDLVINKMMINELSKYGRVFVDCYNSPIRFKSELLRDNKSLIDVYDTYGISLKKLDLIRFNRLAKREGIDLFVTSPGPIGGGNTKRTLHSFAFTLISKAIKRAGIQRYSIGNCCSSAIFNKKKITNSYIDKYYLRSNISVNYLKSQGYDASYIPDLAYLLQGSGNIDQRDKVAMLTFRAPRDINSFYTWYDEITDLLLSRGYKIKLYYQVKGDRDFVCHLYNRKINSNIIFKEEILWYNDFELYSNAEIVISNRLHALLVGAVYGATPLAVLSDDHVVAKIKDVFDSSFQGYQDEFITDFFDINKFHYFVDNIERLQKILFKIKMNNKATCQEVFSQIANNFNNC